MSFVQSLELASMGLTFKCLIDALHGKIPRISSEQEKENKQKSILNKKEELFH